MISRYAVAEWIRRPLLDLNYFKALPLEHVKRKLNELVPPPQFYTEPYSHQYTAMYVGSIFSSLMLFLGLGLGKTKVILDLAAQKIAAGRVNKCLVLVPTLVLQGSWKYEASIHQPGLRVVVLEGSKDERYAQWMSDDVDVLITTYQGLLNFICDKREGKKGKNEWYIDTKNKYLRLLLEQLQMVVYDESANTIISHDSLYFKAAKLLASICHYRYALTGTPFGKDPEGLWAQLYALDFGDTLGGTLGLMREAFYTSKPGYFGGMDRKFRKDMTPVLRRMINNRAIHYSREECTSLPEITYVKVPIVLPDETEVYYKRLVSDFIRAQDNVELMQNIFVRTRYLTSGYLTGKAETGEEIVSYFPNNPKLDALLGLINQLPEGEKVVIFNDYIISGTMISNALKQAKIKHARVYGGTSNKDGELRRFRDDPNTNALLLNTASGALGLNLQCAAYTIYFECPVSPILREQSIGRTHRSGQTQGCFVYDLCCVKTVDEKVLNAVNAGIDLFQAIISGRERL